MNIENIVKSSCQHRAFVEAAVRHFAQSILRDGVDIIRPGNDGSIPVYALLEISQEIDNLMRDEAVLGEPEPTPENGAKLRWFHFRQNNSGGSFDRNENVNRNVFVQAVDAAHANARAQEIGIYFYGCSDGRDCQCCGDRWSPVNDDDGTDVPELYGEALEHDDLAETVLHPYNS